MPRRETTWLSEMRDAARQAHSYASDTDFDAFIADQMRVDATVRQMEIIGEASKSISMTTKMARPEVDWNALTRARNRFIHAYFSVDTPTLWSAARDEMPILADQLDAILNPPKEDKNVSKN